MKKTLYILIGLLLSTLLLNSCKDYLVPENKVTGGQTADGYFSTNPEALRTYAYSLMKPIAKRTDVFAKGTDLYMMTHQKTVSQFQNYILTPENNDVKSLYADCYACINAANALIFYDKEQKYTDEAVFIRSYMYYILSQQFGAVPYISEYINNANRNYPRTPLADLYASLISDLTTIANSTVLAEENHSGYASKRAVAALLAKVYLAAGWDLGTTLTDAVAGTYSVNDVNGYFAKAAEWADKTIKMGAVQDLTTMTFEQKWSPNNEGNGEEIFSVQYELAGYPGAVAEGGHGLQNHYGSYFDNPSKTGGKYSDSEDGPTAKANQMWEAGDQRYAATFMTTMYGYDGTNYNKGYFAYYNLDATAQAELPIWKVYFPYTATEADVTTFLAANQSRFAMTQADGSVNQVLTPKAYLLGDKVTVWEFNADGTVAKKTTNTATYEDALFNELDYAPTVKKWDDPNTIQANGNTNCYRDIVLLHLSDIFLVAAEAYLMAGDDKTSITYINAIRTRAGLGAASFDNYEPAYATKTLRPIDLILDERAKELYAEGHRWMDLRRTKQLVHYNVEYSYYISDVSQMQNTAGVTKWYRPIPQAEINSNEGISEDDQNAGY